MAAMAAAFESSLNEGAYGAALALDTVCYSVWIAVLLVVRYAPKWNQVVKADTSKLDAVADAANAELSKRKALNNADLIFLVGLSLVVSVVSQKAGAVMDGWLCSAGLEMFGASTCTTLFVTILGLICALSPLGRLSGVEELSSLYLYSVSRIWSPRRCGWFTASPSSRCTRSSCLSYLSCSAGICAWCPLPPWPISAVPPRPPS